ncbi:MAG: HlyD family efflux transporter periplasmic adaptor subunit [Bacteroidota bacterium]
MNRLVPDVRFLAGIAMSVLLASCGNTVPDERTLAAQEAAEKTELSYTIKKKDLILLPAKSGSRAVRTTIGGRVISKNTTQLFAEVQGTIKSTSRPFKAGIDFKKGETLVRIDREEFELSLESQRSAFLNVLTGMLPDLKSDYPDSYDQWLTYVKGYQFGNALKVLPEPKSTEEKFYLTTNQVYQLFFQIKSLEERLSKYTIAAPYSGTITASNIDVGSLVSPGQPLGTIANRLNYELEAGVPISVAERLKKGDKITFANNQLTGSWTGTVVRINKIVDPATQNIPVYFRLEGKGLKSGMYLEGAIEANMQEGVMVIPSAALGRDESVLVLQGDVIRRKAVTPIDFLQDSIVVKGLVEQDVVILNQFDIPVEGSKVAL